MKPAQLRNALAAKVTKALLPKSFSIISDDCWGGQIYRKLQIPYETPTVGFWVEKSYIEFLKNLRKSDASFLIEQKTDRQYPVGKTPYAELHFMHYSDFETAESSFKRRFKRINWGNLRIKIDFGKHLYSDTDIEEWNTLALPNSVALVSSARRHTWSRPIHNGIEVPDWVLDGSAMFDITRKHFDVIKWIKTGRLQRTPFYALMNNLLLDPTSPRKLKRLFTRNRGCESLASQNRGREEA